MSNGFIDSATLYEVVALFSEKDVNKTSKWLWNSAITSTITFSCLRNIKMVPSPDVGLTLKEKTAENLYGITCGEIANILEEKILIDNEVRNQAIDQTKSWISENIDTAKTLYLGVLKDDSFNYWINNSITSFWKDHYSRNDGLFNMGFIKEISLVMDCEEKHLKELQRISGEENKLAEYANGKQDSDFEYLKNAYVVSALLRGVYHDYYAKASNLQIIHHPMRERFLPETGVMSEKCFESSTADHLARIILSSALKESNPEKRVKRWGEFVEKARKRILSGEFNLSDGVSDKICTDKAVEMAKKMDIPTYPKYLEDVLDITASLAMGGATTFILQNWPSFAVGAGYSVFPYVFKKSVGKAILKRATEKSLLGMANYEPGRVKRKF